LTTSPSRSTARRSLVSESGCGIYPTYSHIKLHSRHRHAQALHPRTTSPRSLPASAWLVGDRRRIIRGRERGEETAPKGRFHVMLFHKQRYAACLEGSGPFPSSSRHDLITQEQAVYLIQPARCTVSRLRIMLSDNAVPCPASRAAGLSCSNTCQVCVAAGFFVAATAAPQPPSHQPRTCVARHDGPADGLEQNRMDFEGSCLKRPGHCVLLILSRSLINKRPSRRIQPFAHA
jgi:hypothetical protein